MRRPLVGAALALFCSVPVLVLAPPAYAADIAVTTTADVVNAKDGLTSLREAVSLANTAGSASTIVLAPQVYTLSICGGAENANATGDLDHTADEPLTLDGGGATITQTCAGDRILHTTHASGSASLADLTVTGGTEFVGSALAFAGDLDLTSVTASGNGVAGGSVISSDDSGFGPTLDVVESTIGPNTGTGVRISFGTVTIDGSLIFQNTGRGVGLVDGALTVTDTVVTQNGTGGVSTTGQGEGLFVLSGSTITNNDGTGVTCSACGSLTVVDSLIKGNRPGPSSAGGGIVVNLDQDDEDDQPYVTITDSTVESNKRDGRGGGLGVFVLELVDEAPMAQIVITGSTFAANNAAGSDGRGAGLYAATGEVRVDNSTFTSNYAHTSGGAIFSSTGEIFLRHATVSGNFSPLASNLVAGDDLTSFASVVAWGTPGAGECAILGTTHSQGYNVGGDGSCLFVGGPGDLNAGGNPELLGLFDNDGPTRTMLPAPGSPLLGRVPGPACTVLTVDQRGVARPDGYACETGAVEVSEPPLGPGGLTSPSRLDPSSPAPRA
jgi:predicted outer membrane repeat protein